MYVSPKGFLIDERMKIAKELMIQQKGITSKEIALQIGLEAVKGNKVHTLITTWGF
ncbi:hypothetical protein ACOI1C_20555 [Bacillus sp. DJP31]|uniref:hypothetical protein n=1 Tax=Bacillus sp. DJP31 TaxID=3409789 RepID=UPI003BB6A151